MKMKCDVIKDLMPSYIDQLLTEESRILVEEHLEECEACKAYYDSLKGEDDIFDAETAAELHLEEIKPLKKIKKKMSRKTMLVSVLSVLCAVMIVVVFVTNVVLSGCVKKLDEPVFVKSLICGSDMDTEIEFITNKKYEQHVKDVEIPNIPDELHVEFYDEEVETWSNYDVHSVNFGVGADELSEDGGLKEDFVFHEMIVKWDDGSETMVDIGTIHMTAYDEDYVVETLEGGSTDLDETMSENYDVFTAKKDLSITKIDIPYMKDLQGGISNLRVNDRLVSELLQNGPIEVKKGEEFDISYTVDKSVLVPYGRVLLEGVIAGETTDGEKFLDTFYLNGFQGRNMPIWIDQQIKNEESQSNIK